MPHLKILSPGLMTTIQDGGRKNLAFYAVPSGGVADRFSAQIAWSLLKQDYSFPIFECTALAPTIQFSHDVVIAISGADFKWTLNGQPISVNQKICVKAGDILKGGRATSQLRGYIAIDATLCLNQVFDSYATSPNAAINSILKKGDTVEFKNNNDVSQLIQLYKGPEFDCLTDSAKISLFHSIYKVSPDSNRMGIRLIGERIEASKGLKESVPVLPGFMQLPPSGLPIILLHDAQTTGGYPRVAYLKERELAKLSQIPLSGEVQFSFIK